MSDTPSNAGPNDAPALNINMDLPFQNNTVPAMLEPDHKFCFSCHKGISCFNDCCKQADVTLTPYDIIRMKRRLNIDSSEFLKEYTVPVQLDAHLPGIKLKTSDAGACLLVTEEGCSVYGDHPTACRYYPIGLMNMKKQDEKEEEQHYFKVKEAHCKGHEESKEQTIAEYREAQGVPEYDEMNHAWYQIVLKKRSTGPTVGMPSDTSLQFFFMCSYDVDRFRRFVMSESFKKTYDLTDDTFAMLADSDEALLRFGFDLQKQVLFAEDNIPLRDGAGETRMQERKEVWELRQQAEIVRYQAEQEQREREVTDGD